MNYSGIVVICRPDEVPAVADRLGELPGVEVHYREQEQGKIVVVQEAETVAAEMDGIKRIKRLPGVILADMMYHYFEEDPGILDGLATRREPDQGSGASTRG
jgi:periplasmic nitrate reductase NapD